MGSPADLNPTNQAILSLVQNVGLIASLFQNLTPSIVAGSGAGGVAAAGGGAGGATQLAAQFNQVDTVAAPGDGVKLLASAAGLLLGVGNASGNGLVVYPFGADVIDGSGAGFALAAGVNALFFCAVAGSWRSV